VDLLDAWIASHPLGFAQPYLDRWVNNVYFDTPALGAYEENLAGLSRRRKLRLRWYGHEHLPASAVFEVKLRLNSLGAKHRTAVELDAPDAASWRDVKEELRAQLRGRTAIDFDSMSDPVILNRYRRTYYVAEHAEVRLTIDRDVRFVDQRLSAYPRYGPAHVLKGYVVFEAKVPAYRDPTRILRNLPMRLSRNSKYVIGIRTVLDGG
jgi:SPX domain protein involved in polyphosphate accumulation